MRILTVFWVLFTICFVFCGCRSDMSLNYSVIKDTSSPPDFHVADKQYGIKFLLQNDDNLKERIIGGWECQAGGQQYNKIMYITSAGKTINSFSQQNSFHAKLFFRKSGKFEIVNDPIFAFFDNAAAEGTWYLRNGIVFVDLKTSNHNFLNLKEVELTAVVHINSAGKLILQWDTSAAENIARKVAKPEIKAFKFYYGTDNHLYLMQDSRVETFKPVHVAVEVSGIYRVPQLEYHRIHNDEAQDKKMLSNTVLSAETVKIISPDMLCASHILIKIPRGSDGDKELLKANVIYAKLLQHSERFGALAAQYSDCPSKNQGGFLGNFKEGQMTPEFEKAVLKLKVNQISKPVKSEFGWHIIKRENPR